MPTLRGEILKSSLTTLKAKYTFFSLFFKTAILYIASNFFAHDTLYVTMRFKPDKYSVKKGNSKINDIGSMITI